MFNKMYPYPGFGPVTDISPPCLFHFSCKRTSLSLCTCPSSSLRQSTVHSLSLLSFDLSSTLKFRKIEKERIQRMPVYPSPPLHEHLKLDSQICDYCCKLVSIFEKQTIDGTSLHLCRDCCPNDSQAKKSLSLSARKKKFGKLLDLGTTQAELARRGRPRIHSRDDDFIQCYFPKCLKRNMKVMEASDLLTCKKCTRTFHAGCADPPLRPDLVTRFNWCCLECKTCSVCGKLREESHVLICDACDRVFHSKCLKVSTSGSFLCQDCANCRTCGKFLDFPYAETNPQWFKGYRFCAECYQRVQDRHYCPVCVKAYQEEDSEAFIMCDHCQLWVHASCERLSPDQVSLHASQSFLCSSCRLISISNSHH
jgi:hypothetical protein